MRYFAYNESDIYVIFFLLLQTLPRPDKGIVYPKAMANLSNVDKAYYVEHFMRSEVFRQRCLRKYQASKTWMNGLSPFQLWVLE